MKRKTVGAGWENENRGTPGRGPLRKLGLAALTRPPRNPDPATLTTRPPRNLGLTALARTLRNLDLTALTR
ncbi:hypothetical protein, partial [Lentzea aerocolonigenes]